MTRDQREDEEDLALRHAGDAARESGVSDDRLADWRAAEARLSQTDAEAETTAADAVVFGARMRARLAAKRAQVRRVMEPPTRYRAPGVEANAPYFALPVAAGIGRVLWDEAPDAHIVVPDDLPAGRYIALPVRGRSMEPLLNDGDVVLVNRDLRPRRGRIVVARDEDDGYVVKRFADVIDGRIALESANAEFSHCSVPAVPGAILGTVVMAWNSAGREMR